MKTDNLFLNAAAPASGECFEPLLTHRNLVIERILSSDTPLPADYIQPQDEWVVLLQGAATLKVAGEICELGPGDYLFLPAGVPHTVLKTAQGSLWLAVHLHAEPERAHSPSA